MLLPGHLNLEIVVFYLHVRSWEADSKALMDRKLASHGWVSYIE